MSERIACPDLASLFWEAGERWSDHPAFSTRQGDATFSPVSYRQWRDRAADLATGLIALGVHAGEHVALLSDNRFEWILTDAAVQFCGAADVPRAADVTAEEVAYILGHADVEIAFVENPSVLAKVERVRDRLPRLRHIILMDEGDEGGDSAQGGVILLRDLEKEGRGLRAGEFHSGAKPSVEARIANVHPEDLFTIIYTSGTTGTPKGVQLTHGAMASQVRNLPFSLDPADRALSILPVWHSYERVFEMVSIASGACTHYTSLRFLGEDLLTVKPTVMASAPRLWEGLYQRILARVGKAPLHSRLLFHCALFSARMVRAGRSFFTGQELDLRRRGMLASFLLGVHRGLGWVLFILPHQLLDRLVLKKLRGVVGGCLRGTISGGGALPPYVDGFFNDIGIPVLEGYGLTESCPVLAVRTWDRLVIGTVGPVFPETEIRIVHPDSGSVLYPDPTRSDRGRGRRGEIQARGPQIMRGYYKDPAGTGRVLRDGWLSTGDLGVMTFNDCLRIVGRCKETIVLRGGENVEPLPIESRLLESPLIDQCMVVGQDQKHLGVLIVPSLAGFSSKGILARDLASLRSHPDVSPLIRGEIHRLVGAAQGFKTFERIPVFVLLEQPFAVGEGLTATFKLKRHWIAERYEGEISALFGS